MFSKLRLKFNLKSCFPFKDISLICLFPDMKFLYTVFKIRLSPLLLLKLILVFFVFWNNFSLSYLSFLTHCHGVINLHCLLSCFVHAHFIFPFHILPYIHTYIDTIHMVFFLFLSFCLSVFYFVVHIYLNVSSLNTLQQGEILIKCLHENMFYFLLLWESFLLSFRYVLLISPPNITSWSFVIYLNV